MIVSEMHEVAAVEISDVLCKPHFWILHGWALEVVIGCSIDDMF